MDPPCIVSRQRISKTLFAIDPVGAPKRWYQTIKRRIYHVGTPNSLWHIDIHHKIIR